MKVKQLPTRQRIRKGLLLLSWLLLPVTLYYFSPALILNGAYEGIVNGSMIVFVGLFMASLFVGRLWCGWACPVGGLQEFAAPINDKPGPRGRGDWTKWAIWIPWIGGIAGLAIAAGGYHSVQPLFGIETGATLTLPPEPEAPPWYMMYYIIVGLFLVLALVFGRRAGCHTVCWIAPFMILGRKVRNLVNWPALRLVAEPDRCSDCLSCSRACPMSLPVHDMAKRASMEDGECILCGTCVDGCTKKAIRFSFSRGK